MKKIPILIVLGTLIAIGGIGFFLIRPTVTSIYDSWKDLKKSESDQKQAEEKKQVIDNLEKNQAQLTTTASTAETYIPSEANAGDLINELSTLAANNNVRVESTKLEQSTAQQSGSQTATQEDTASTSPNPTPKTTAGSGSASKGQTVQFSLQLTANYTDLVNFLKAVEIGQRLVVIKNITVRPFQASAVASPAPTAVSPGALSVELKGEAYYKTKVTLENTIANLQVSQETIALFNNLRNYTQLTLQPSDGFGRVNPFESY